MKTSRHLGRTLARVLVVAALGLPVAAHAATATYTITTPAQLVGMASTCAANSYYNGCGATQPGFTWPDTITAGSTISAVSITFNDGVDCHTTGSVRTTRLNATAGGTYLSTADCFCAPSVKLRTVALPISAYVIGGTNVFATTNPTTCLGSARTTIGGVLAYAQITVTFTAGTGGGGTGTCNLAPIEAKLDDGTRFTSDAERTNLLNGIVAEINQNEVKIDAVRNAVAALETKADAAAAANATQARSEMERALGEDTNFNRPMALYSLPAANGGKLEAIRALVAKIIADENAAGCNTNGAAASLAAGDAAYAGGQWDAAFVNFSQAYHQSTAGPCN